MARKKLTVQTRLGEQTIEADKIIRFPRGLVGYEHCVKFTLLQLRPDSPFLILQSLDNPDLGLLVADPYTFVAEYCIHVGTAEQTLLRVTDIHQVAVLVTVTIPHGKPERTAINLTGPILINHERRMGLQVPQAEGLFPSQVLVYQAGTSNSRSAEDAGTAESAACTGIENTEGSAANPDSATEQPQD